MEKTEGVPSSEELQEKFKEMKDWHKAAVFTNTGEVIANNNHMTLKQEQIT